MPQRQYFGSCCETQSLVQRQYGQHSVETKGALQHLKILLKKYSICYLTAFSNLSAAPTTGPDHVTALNKRVILVPQEETGS